MSKQLPMEPYRDGRENESLRIKDFSSLITLALLGTVHKFLMQKIKTTRIREEYYTNADLLFVF